MVDIGHGRGWLSDAAAASLWRVDARIGHPLDINEAGRTWAQQKAFWDAYQRNGWPIALHPDTPSIHQLGNAIDTDEQITAILNDHGWYHTVYRGGKLVEPWHYEYQSWRDNHINGGSAAGSSDDMGAAEMAKLTNIEALLAGTGPSLQDPNWHAGQGSVLNHLQNLSGFVYAGGTSTGDPNYLGSPGTLYNLAKTPVSRSIDGKVQKVSQIQDNADTNTMVRELTVRLSALDAAVKALAVASGADPEAIADIVESGVKAAMKDISFKTEIATTDAE